MAQSKAILKTNIATIYCEFEDPNAYRHAIELTRQASPSIRNLGCAQNFKLSRLDIKDELCTSYYPINIPKSFDDLTNEWDEIDIKSKRLLLFCPETSPWMEIQDN
ncbi:hypothetical protein [[Leptolyngbya] sp. PCC 7376]|uniref:hypothetical protein n=1 Tax=[Leptolyngbya] sp. PCC 7376 TaxID=111781 RepID=UPI0005A2CDC8|nr:hypothetical protein [[Leptolyngbya] sp. PCC 7376]